MIKNLPDGNDPGFCETEIDCMNEKIKTETEILLDTIVSALQEKQGKDIVNIDLSILDNPICNWFVICHGDSAPQVQALASWVEEYVERTLDIRLWRKQGLENSQWVILIYDDIVVHIFQKEFRDFYKLEDLWADGKLTQYLDTFESVKTSSSIPYERSK